MWICGCHQASYQAKSKTTSALALELTLVFFTAVPLLPAPHFPTNHGFLKSVVQGLFTKQLLL